MNEPGAPAGQFPLTRWTRVLLAGGEGAESEQALDEICRLYWYPLYVFVRRQGKAAEDAQDLTQGFFANFLESGALLRVDREKGRLRSFLLGALKNFMAYEHRKETTQKRGGGVEMISIDMRSAEERYGHEPKDVESPDLLFERRWAIEILNRAVTRLGREYSEKGMEKTFDELGPLLAGQEAVDYDGIAERLGMRNGAVRTALSRMRKRYRACLVDEISETVVSPDLVDDELENLVAALRDSR